MAAAGPYLYPALIGLGSSVIGAVGNSKDDRQSYEDGDPTVDPRALMHQAVDRSNQLWDRLSDPNNIYRPTHLGVQDSPVFTGGGLPMPVGLLGSWQHQGDGRDYGPHLTPGPNGPDGMTRYPTLPNGPGGGNGPPNGGPQGPNPPGAGNGGGRNGNGPPTRRDPNRPDDPSPDFPGGRPPGTQDPVPGNTTPDPPDSFRKPAPTLPPGIIPGVGRRSLTGGIPTNNAPVTAGTQQSDAARLMAALQILGVRK